MFLVVFHPPSGARNTVATVSGINETVTATFRERDRTGTPFNHAHEGISTVPINARYCRYSVMSSC
jgi:hypothetical protein